MEIENVISLINAVSEAKIMNFQIEEGNFKLTMDKNERKIDSSPSMVYQIPNNYSKNDIQTSPVSFDTPVEETYPIGKQDRNDISKEINNVKKTDNQVDDLKVVKSPIVGTFYSASSPDADDFVKVGDHVKKGQILCVIEAMKLMNDIESDFDGIIQEILVKNEQMVEYNQPLFRII